MEKSKLSLRFASVCMILILCFSIAGCSSGNSASGSGTTAATDVSGTSGAVTTTEAVKPVTLKLIAWQNEATINALNMVTEKVKEKYPNISMEVNAVDGSTYSQLQQTRLAANDIDFITNGMYNPVPDWAKGMDKPDWLKFIEAGYILDLTDQPFLSNWDPVSLRDATTVNGKVYGIDTGKVAYNGVFYSKDIFDKYDLKLPNNWEEFIALCEKLKANGVTPLTGSGKNSGDVNFLANGFINANVSDPVAFEQALWDGSKKYTDPDVVAIYKKLYQFFSYYEKDFTNVDYASVPGRFVAGKAAMYADGTWQAAQISAVDPNFKFGYFAIPGDATGAGPQQLAGKYDVQIAVVANSPNKDECLKWLSVLSEKDVYSEYVNIVGFIPTMKGITIKNEFLNELAPLNVNFQKNFELIQKLPKGIGKFGGFIPTMYKIIGGTVNTPEELAAASQKDWDDAMKALK